MAKPTISGPGRLDAMVANVAGDNISVRLGNGSGGFVANSGPPEPTGDSPERLVLGDINNDGLVDVAAANFGSDNVTIRLRSEEHTSELQSQSNLVCRLLLEKKKKNNITDSNDTK